jgi:8-oxo-dGTP pyrophosphatase MutT (NUDIX family)
MEHFKEPLQRALSLSVPYSFDPDGRLSRAAPRGVPSAVLIFLEALAPSRSPMDLSVILTRRSDLVEHHKGQIAFPGGVQDPEDLSQGGLVATALREAHEELGIEPSHVQVVGNLPEMPTVTGFWISPVVALPSGLAPPSPISAVPRTVETAEVFRVSLRDLEAPGIWRREWVEHRGQSGVLSRHPVDAFYWQSHRIWGATGAMLRNLIDRMKQLEEAI